MGGRNIPERKFVVAGTPAEDVRAATCLRGWQDAANGRPFPPEYDSWKRGSQINYEMGRHRFVAIAVASGKPRRWRKDEQISAVYRRVGWRAARLAREMAPDEFYSSGAPT